MLLATACLGSVVAGSTGCTITRGLAKSLDQSECLDEFMVGYRNRALAEKAWHCRVGKHNNRMHGKEFKDGFIDGYMDVASGGSGCIPTIAPSKYWGWRYQSANGQQAINSYFQGYPLGVRAAEQDGVGHWQSLQVYSPPAAVVPPHAEDHGVENPFYSEEEILMDSDAMSLPGPGGDVMEIEQNI